jgi:glycosyltransferase involved in cell wall biosynthesis
MIARELTEFFAGFADQDAGPGAPVLQRSGSPSFLSNVNACYARSCWEQIRFREVAYSEDQAFGSDMLAAGWTKVYHPQAAVLHAHDYRPVEFMRRYFDEYRGLHESTGHIEPFAPTSAARDVTGAVRADRKWMKQRDLRGAQLARWTARSAVHHGGRRVFSALGSRSEQLPRAVQRGLSLERRQSASDEAPSPDSAAQAGDTSGMPATVHVPAKIQHDDYEACMRVREHGPVALLDAAEGMAERERLRLAMVIPPFSRGSGGHNTLFQIFSRLERRGHACSVWLSDFHGYMRAVWPAVLRNDIREFFAPFEGPVYNDFSAWQGADVVIATGWQTVHESLLLDGCRTRAYCVNDHEPEFFATSIERTLAEDTYRHGMHCIAASPWLRDLLIDRYGASADAFELGADHSIYRPRAVERDRNTVVYYARHTTPRRAVPVGLMALTELKRRRPDTRVVLFGADSPSHSAFPFEHLGVLSADQLACLYSEATVGLCLSLTNFSLMPKEMLACGLPCVELEGVSAESIFGADGPLELAALDPGRIADRLERLLDNRELWERRSREGIEFVASHTWDRATDQVEAGLRHALRKRELALASQP